MLQPVTRFPRLVSVESFRRIHVMISLRLRAVLYREDGLWVAHALEMDLIGTGATESAALPDLASFIRMVLGEDVLNLCRRGISKHPCNA